jgi:hypothetical protein
MTVINKLACSLNRRDEVPNQELAKLIAAKNNKEAVKELVENLYNKSRDIQYDCIKVLYEVGAQKPELIAAYAKDLLALLDNKNNRLQWGGMTALYYITNSVPKQIYASLPKIMKAADKGSVITRNNAVNILIDLCSFKPYAHNAFSLLLEQLHACPTNQLPMYAERAMPVISGKNKPALMKALGARLDDIEKDSKRKRVEKVMKRLAG